MGGEAYTQREDFFPYHLPGARMCQCFHPPASSSETPPISCVSLSRLLLCLNLTAWLSSRGLLLVTRLLYPTALIVLSCLLITTWQLVKAHRITRNEPKIHGICYMTFVLRISPSLIEEKWIMRSFTLTLHVDSMKFLFSYAFSVMTFLMVS